MDLIEIIRQIKYDAQQIDRNLECIKRSKEKLEEWEGKPIYDSTIQHIKHLESEVNDCIKSIKEFSFFL